MSTGTCLRLDGRSPRPYKRAHEHAPSIRWESVDRHDRGRGGADLNLAAEHVGDGAVHCDIDDADRHRVVTNCQHEALHVLIGSKADIDGSGQQSGRRFILDGQGVLRKGRPRS